MPKKSDRSRSLYERGQAIDRLGRRLDVEGPRQRRATVKRLKELGVTPPAFDPDRQREALASKLEHTGGDLGSAARRLKLTRQTLYRAGLHSSRGRGRPRAKATQAAVWALHCDGLTFAAIARKLGCSERTVKRRLAERAATPVEPPNPDDVLEVEELVGPDDPWAD